MTREPSFVLASGGSAVIAEGVHTAFPKLAEARAALASHSAPIILGALPFDMSKPAALIRPQAIQFLDALPDWPLRGRAEALLQRLQALNLDDTTPRAALDLLADLQRMAATDDVPST